MHLVGTDVDFINDKVLVELCNLDINKVTHVSMVERLLYAIDSLIEHFLFEKLCHCWYINDV